MNVSTIAVSQDQAISKIESIKALKRPQRTDEDDALLALFTAVRKHNSRVVDLGKAFKQTGLNELGQPKLAIARADWGDVFFYPRRQTRLVGKRNYESIRWVAGTGTFGSTGEFHHHAYVSNISLPRDTFPDNLLATSYIKSPVPHVPAEHRPKYHLRNYHILFEVEKWSEYPVDPFLLKHITGNIYVVLAEWDLTEVEASILGGMRGL